MVSIDSNNHLNIVEIKKRVSPMHLVKTLIVDDSADECRLLSVLLADTADIEVIGSVHDGSEALKYLDGMAQFQDRGAFPFPDLILLDFEMPRLNGLEVLARMDQTRGRPFIVLWSNTLEHVNSSTAFALGADMVMKKPANCRELYATIDVIKHRIYHPYSTSPTPDTHRAGMRKC